MLATSIGRLRLAGLAEGVSFLLLLFVAMPLKYLAGHSEAVSVIGLIHGLLFIVFGMVLLQAMIEHQWPIHKAALPFLAALVPFGPFLIDKRLQTEEDAALEGGREDNKGSEEGGGKAPGGLVRVKRSRYHSPGRSKRPRLASRNRAMPSSSSRRIISVGLP